MAVIVSFLTFFFFNIIIHWLVVLVYIYGCLIVRDETYNIFEQRE